MPSKQEQPAATSKAISLSPLKFRDALKGLLAVDPKAIPPAPARTTPGVSAKKKAPAKKKPKASGGKKKR